MSMKPLKLTDKNVMEQIEKNLKGLVKEINNFDILVGIPASVKGEDGDTVAEYALKNERGVIGGSGVAPVPARPFLTTTFERYKDEASKIMVKILKDMAFKNSKAEPALNMIAIHLAALVQKNIKIGPWDPNSPMTIRMKKSSRPLIDTGTMRRSVTGWTKPRAAK